MLASKDRFGGFSVGRMLPMLLRLAGGRSLRANIVGVGCKGGGGGGAGGMDELAILYQLQGLQYLQHVEYQQVIDFVDVEEDIVAEVKDD
jgi:hypothetical protein